jgi:BirA family biotin operon repressor/biotin-[acetyl-CoA-carboxylase] ligase
MHADSPPIVDPPLLDALLRATGPLTVQALAMSRGVGPGSGPGSGVAAARRELDRLRQAGCVLDMHPQHGVTLRASGLATWTDYLRWSLGQGRSITCYRRTASTQDAARRLAERSGRAADAAVVIAEEQTAGRGRLGRRWIAPRGSAVTFSRVVASGGPIDTITFVASVAVCRAVQRFVGPRGLRATIKWPNDVQVRGWKIAGILVESAGDAAVGGVGLNTHLRPPQLPVELDGRVTSMAMLGVEVDRLLVLAETLRQIDRALAEPTESLLAAWRDHSTMLHHRATLRHGGHEVTGEVIDLDPTAGLIVRRDSGEIVHLPAATTTVVR